MVRSRTKATEFSLVCVYFIITMIIIIYLSWSWVTCWPVPVLRIQKSLQRSTMIPSTRRGVVFHYPGYSISRHSFHETCQWLKFPLNGLQAKSSVSPVVGLLHFASGPAYLWMAFPPFLVKQLYRCDSVVISSFVRTGYTTRRWGWLLGRVGYNITYHYPFCMLPVFIDVSRCIVCY